MQWKKGDFELKSIDENAYIKKYNKLSKDYKKLVNTCLYYFQQKNCKS